MMCVFSLVLQVKNIALKIWSIKPLRYLLCVSFAVWMAYNWYGKIATRLAAASLTYPGWEALMPSPDFGFNPDFIKSNKASFGIGNALSRLASVYVPGILFVGIILYLQTVLNTFKAPPLPILYSGEDADDVLVADHTLPILYTRGEGEYEEEDEDDELPSSGILVEEGAVQ